jgi:hypothetical protein
VSTPAGFAPPPPVEAPADRRGCLKKSLIGCGVVAILIAACLIAVIVYVRQRPDVFTDMVMKQVESHYAADVTAEEKEQLRSAYADFRTALREHRVSRDPLDRMRTTLVSSGSQSEVTRQQVRDLTELFRKAAGGGVPAPSPVPVSTSSPRATP